MKPLPSPLILASASPRRRELLTEMGVRFEVITADVREHDSETAPHLAPAELACENAWLKADAVVQSEKGARRWILGADTVVALDEQLFGKPSSIEEAAAFLRTLSGRTHEVITGCALLDPDQQATIFHETTLVTFRALSDETIQRYLSEVHVLDKAGAYALQERGEWIIERIEGSRTNVIGLPIEAIERVLRQHRLF